MASVRRQALSSYKDIKQVLCGERFGTSQSSLLSRTRNRVSQLKSKCEANNASLGRADVVEFDTLSDLASELQLGGSCEHGADQGPKCRHCAGVLKGNYVNRDVGLDVIDYLIPRVGLSTKEKDRLMIECDRISEVLTETDKDLKVIKSVLQRVREQLGVERTEKPAVKRTRSVEDTVNKSIEQIKREAGVNPDVLFRSHDILNQELKSAKVCFRFKCGAQEDLHGEVLVSQSDLEAEHEDGTVSPFEWLKSEVVRDLEKRTGICVTFSSFAFKDTVIADAEAFSRAIESGSLEDQVYILQNLDIVNHASFLECFKKYSGGANDASSDSALDARLAQVPSQTPSLRLLGYVIPDPLFPSVRYRDSLRLLDLSRSSFSPLALARAALTLPNLEELNLSSLAASTLRKSEEDDDDEHSMGAAFQVWAARSLPRLRALNMSGRDFAEFGDADLASFASFLTVHPQLERLKMNRCFAVARGQSYSDETSFRSSQFLSCRFVAALPTGLKSLEFCGNAFPDSLCAVSFIRELLIRTHSGLEALNLAECRTWSCFEDDEAEDDEDNLVTKSTSSSDHLQGIGLGLRSYAEAVKHDQPLSRLSALVSLCLAGCGVGDEGLKALAIAAPQFPALQTLDVSNVGATARGLREVLTTKWTSLQRLSLSFNDSECFASDEDLSFSLQGFLKDVRTMERLEMIGMKGVTLTDWKDGSSLRTLVISSANDVSSLVESAASSENLQSVFVVGECPRDNQQLVGGWMTESFPNGLLLSRG